MPKPEERWHGLKVADIQVVAGEQTLPVEPIFQPHCD